MKICYQNAVQGRSAENKSKPGGTKEQKAGLYLELWLIAIANFFNKRGKSEQLIALKLYKSCMPVQHDKSA